MKLSSITAALQLAVLAISYVAAIDTYDVVIIGSGPGGLVAAEYLSRDPNVTVLVLEAGGPSLQETGGTDGPAYAKSKGFTKFDIPGEYDNAGSIFNNANAGYRVDWISDEPSYLGKLVGGCSSINAALYFRTPDSYVDSTKWPFDASRVSAGFDAIEQMVGHTDSPSPDGKWYLQEAYNIVAQAFKQRGQYSEVTINDATARNHKDKTFGHAPFAFKNGLRDSPAKVFYGAFKNRPNAKLLTFATASYIKHYRGRATGVVYNNNVEVALSSRGAVIMAAGAMSTPKVLIQSGIGPSDQLNMLSQRSDFPGVTQTKATGGWVINENVGKNLFDTNAEFASFSHPEMVAVIKKQSQQWAIDQYMNQGQSGVMAYSGPVLIGYENYTVNGRAYEFQTTISPNGFGEFGSNPNAFFAALYINNPESRDYSSFDANGKWIGFTKKSIVMSSANDIAAMKSYTQKIVNMFTQNGAKFLSANAGESTDAWIDRNKGWKTNHFGGSCYTSSDVSDAKRCSDENLNVVGTSNIFVSDASLQKEGTVNPYGFMMYVGYEAGNVVKNYLSKGSPVQPQCSAASVLSNVDFAGLDIGSAPSATAEGCCSVCQKFNGCQAFSWTNTNGGTCYLKSSKGAAIAKAGVFSAVVPPMATTPPTCPNIEKDVDYGGKDVGSALSTTAEGCCALCQTNKDCGAFSWNNYNGGTCWLKSVKGVATGKSGVYSAVVSKDTPTPTVTTPAPTTPAPTTPAPTTPAPSSCPAIEEGIDYTGNDIGSVQSPTAEGCCAQCSANTNCRAFSWNNYNGGTCWLKNGKGAFTTKSGTRSAVIRSSCSTLEVDVDYSGADVANALAPTADSCCGICRARTDCKAFTWTNYNGGTCWLKSGRGTASPKAGAKSATLL